MARPVAPRRGASSHAYFTTTANDAGRQEPFGPFVNFTGGAAPTHRIRSLEGDVP
jgi:hypothetical protein